jgi:methyltransferase (TIGR00027 family)
MNTSHPGTTPSNSSLAAAAFYVINVLLFPLTLIGYVLHLGYLLLARQPGVSTSAQGPLSARWTQHHLGVRKDEAASRLMASLLGFFPFGWYLAAGPMLLAHRLTGYVPKAFRYPYEADVAPQHQASARQTFFDAVVERYLADITQLVILGAGFDTRAYRLPADAHVHVFEVDGPKTQAVKRQLLEKTGIDASGVTFVSADFEREDWFLRLVQAGFDLEKRALFLWEGVVHYLDREAVEASLRKIASTARGSAVAFDYFTTEPLKSQELYWRFGRAAARAAGEPLKFGIDSRPPSRERLNELLQSCGLSLVEQRTLGEETRDKRAWGGFAIAIVK